MTRQSPAGYNERKVQVSTISYSIEVQKKVKEAFEEKRKKAFEEAEARKAQVYAAVEGIRGIDEALAKTGLKVYAAALDKTNPLPLEQRIETLREENAELQRVRGELLEQAGFPAGFTKVRFSCPDCQDTGYVGIKPCHCRLQALREESYSSSGLGALLSDQSFDNFSLTVYPEKDRRMMSFILSEARRFAGEFGEEGAARNVMFYGGTGLGKTHLSTAIAKTVIDRGFDVVYDSALNLMHAFEKERFSKTPSISTDRYFSCDLLILDDLGAEFMSSFTHSTLYNLLNTRIYGGKGTLVSTNLSSTEELRKTYEERIVSRLVGEFKSYGFVGEDIRLLTRRKNAGADRKREG